MMDETVATPPGVSDAAVARPAATPGTCVVCDAMTEQAAVCCSLRCARQAERELQRNVARTRRLTPDADAATLRRALAERNGRLSSALLRWRPAETPAQPPHAGPLLPETA